jgi:hypothetical protein
MGRHRASELLPAGPDAWKQVANLTGLGLQGSYLNLHGGFIRQAPSTPMNGLRVAKIPPSWG